MDLRAFCAVWRCFCALCPCVARRLLLCCCSAFLGICCGFAAAGALLRCCCFCSGCQLGGVSFAGVSAAAPHLLKVACSVFGSLRAVSACSVGGPRFGVPSGRGYLFGVLRTLCGLCAASLIGAGAASLLGCWGPSEGPRAAGRAFSDPPGAACYPRRGRKKSGPFLKSVRTEFSRRFLGPTLNLHRLRATTLKLRRLKKLKISPYARTRRVSKKSPKNRQHLKLAEAEEG